MTISVTTDPRRIRDLENLMVDIDAEIALLHKLVVNGQSKHAASAVTVGGPLADRSLIPLPENQGRDPLTAVIDGDKLRSTQ